MTVFDGFNVYVALAINGIFSGLGAALGSYIAQNHIIKKGQSVMKEVTRWKTKK